MHYNVHIIGYPLFRLGDYYFYNPVFYVLSAAKFVYKPGFADLYIHSIRWFLYFGIFSLILAFINTLIINYVTKSKGNIHGTAQLMDMSNLKELGYTNKRGVICGECEDAVVKAKAKKGKDPVSGEPYASTALSLTLKKPGTLICHSGDINTLLLAPTGSGKGVGVIVPTLLSILKSVIVLDPKGENFEKTGQWRSKFSYVLKFDPTSFNTLRFNPVLEIRDGIQYAFRDCDLIADIIFEKNKNGGGNDASEYFNNSAKTIVTASLLHIRFSDHNDKSFAGLRDFLVGGSKEEIDRLLNAPQGQGEASPDLGKEQARIMAETKHYFVVTEEMYNEQNYTIHDKDGTEITRNHFEDRHIAVGDKYYDPQLDDMIKKGAAEILQTNAKEKASTWKTIASKIRLFDDPTVREATRASDFRIDDFLKTDRPISLYLVVPYSDIERLAPIMKIIITLLLKRLSGGQTSFGHKALPYDILLILDEFPILGNFPVIAEEMGVLRGYGVFFLIVCQALNQLVDRYGQNHPFLDHCTVHIIYAPGNIGDAELYSRSIGNETVREEKVSRSGRLKIGDSNLNYSDNCLGRALFDAADIMRIPKDKFLLRIQNEQPYIGTKVVYYMDYRFKDKVGREMTMDELYKECRGLPSTKRYLKTIEENKSKELAYKETASHDITYDNPALYEVEDDELNDSINFEGGSKGSMPNNVDFDYEQDAEEPVPQRNKVSDTEGDEQFDEESDEQPEEDVKPGKINIDALYADQDEDDDDDIVPDEETEEF